MFIDVHGESGRGPNGVTVKNVTLNNTIKYIVRMRIRSHS
jgi:hypothetical protein